MMPPSPLFYFFVAESVKIVNHFKLLSYYFLPVFGLEIACKYRGGFGFFGLPILTHRVTGGRAQKRTQQILDFADK